MILPSQAKLAAAAALAIAMAGLLIWGLYWRGEYREAKAALTVYATQAAVNKAAVDRCSAGADEAARVGKAAIDSMGPLLESARRARADLDKGAKALDELARRPRAAGEDCNWAWDQIELNRKARATP